MFDNGTATINTEICAKLGYNFRRADEMKISDSEGESSHGAGLSFGGGIMLERFKLSVAYGKYHVSSTSLNVNVSYQL